MSSDDMKMVNKDKYIKRQKTEVSYDFHKEREEERKKLKSLDINAILSKNYDYKKDQRLDMLMNEDIKRNLPMIDREFNKQIPLCRFQLYAFFAAQKQGKTSFGAAICHGLYVEDEKSLVITNEEMTKDVLGRIASIELGYNYNSFILGKYDDSRIGNDIAKKRQDVAKYVDVVSQDDADTMDADVLCKILDHVGDKGYQVIIIDYISKVCKRSKVTIKNSWEAQEPLMFYLDALKKRTDKHFPPIIVFSQLKKNNKKNPIPFKERLEGRKLLPNFATGVFEIIKCPKDGTTIIDIVDSRWYGGINGWIFDFNKGRYTTSEKNKIFEVLKNGK